MINDTTRYLAQSRFDRGETLTMCERRTIYDHLVTGNKGLYPIIERLRYHKAAYKVQHPLAATAGWHRTRAAAEHEWEVRLCILLVLAGFEHCAIAEGTTCDDDGVVTEGDSGVDSSYNSDAGATRR